MSILILVVAVAGGGAGLILIARWARRRNASMGGASPLSTDSGKVSLAQVFLGSRSSIESGLGHALATFVIIAVLAFLAFAAYVVFVKS